MSQKSCWDSSSSQASLCCLAGSQETHFCASTLPSRLPSVTAVNSICQAVEPSPALPEGELGFRPKLSPGTVAGKGGPPGFPTLKTLELEAELKNAGVNVLGQASKKASLILTVKVSLPTSPALPPSCHS